MLRPSVPHLGGEITSVSRPNQSAETVSQTDGNTGAFQAKPNSNSASTISVTESATIPLNSGPNIETARQLDETMVHWIMEGADTRNDAIERAALLLTRNLSVSALLRWQLELLASEGQADSCKPDAMQGISRDVTEFLLTCDWQNVSTGWSPTLDAANRLLVGEANRRDLKLVALAVQNGAPDEWDALIGEIDIIH